ncbi:lysylphosphatidylglycerol synthase transmembrane domain-containing protein [Truepera radiovictrix]|uniref:Integral membrane protein n=1 Tax=Truepera radiovictrix (strain DSM 17093 / CIP 108686 / LMG 22925 / RQ-24) TaxID=649638 RepID=D7CUY4_TRURR|nr:flippase-like domain-containing protein [Truepera radiovictrix]ADI15811.1 conserved hypothetical protein [Truepera radiovictrix DSM 17093]WMT58561.1 flippase-like domain-containing protein [Truepera radiovictrix]
MDAPRPRPPRLRALLWTALAAMLGYAALTLWSGAAETAAAMRRLGLSGALLALLLALANYALRFGRWQLYLAHLGAPVALRPSLRAYLASFTFTATPGKVGEAVRAIYLKPHGVPYAASLSALFVERLIDLAAMLLLAALGVLHFGRYAPLVALPLGAVLGIVLLFRSTRFRRWARAQRVLARAEGVLSALEATAALSRGRPLVVGALLSLVGWGLEALALHVILLALGFELPLTASLGIYGLAVAVGALSFLPGGLGGMEATMILLLSLSGVGVADAGAVTLLLRFATLWFAVLIGAPFAVGFGRVGAQVGG